MFAGIRFIVSLAAVALLSQASLSQPLSTKPVNEILKENKPYRILTAGKSITVKSNQTIKNLMVWTSDGHRVLEQKDINASAYTFRISLSAKVYFLMIQLENGKRYTEKIGID